MAEIGKGDSRGGGAKSRQGATLEAAKMPVDPEEAEKSRRAHYVSILCAVTMETDKGIKRICETLRKEDPDFPAARTLRLWMSLDEDLNAQYARAKDEQLEYIAEQILEISDDDSLDTAFSEDGKAFVDKEHIQRSKLRVDSRKWILSKLKPKKYGDKVVQEVSGPDGGPQEHLVAAATTPEEFTEFRALFTKHE